MFYYNLPFLVVQRINCINDAIKIKTTTLEFSNFRNQVPKFDKYAVFGTFFQSALPSEFF